MGKFPISILWKVSEKKKEKCVHLRLCVALSTEKKPKYATISEATKKSCMFYAFLFFFLSMARCLLIRSFSFSFIISLRQPSETWMEFGLFLSPLKRCNKKQSNILKFNVKWDLIIDKCVVWCHVKADRLQSAEWMNEWSVVVVISWFLKWIMISIR